MTQLNPYLTAFIRSVRPALRVAHSSEQDRARFVYDLVCEIYDYAHDEVSGVGLNPEECAHLGKIVDAALPPVLWPPA